MIYLLVALLYLMLVSATTGALTALSERAWFWGNLLFAAGSWLFVGALIALFAAISRCIT